MERASTTTVPAQDGLPDGYSSPLRIGPFGVLAFHNFQPGEAARVHLECCKISPLSYQSGGGRGRNKNEEEVEGEAGPSSSTTATSSSSSAVVRGAAVIDHRYIFSFSQLCVALHRLVGPKGEGNVYEIEGKKNKGGGSNGGGAVGPNSASSPFTHLQICKALACSHNTESLMHKLPPGKTCASVVIIWWSPEEAEAEEDEREDGSNPPPPCDHLGAKRPRAGERVPSSRLSPENTANPPPPQEEEGVGVGVRVRNDVHQGRFLLEADAIDQAVRRASPNAVLHSLISSTTTTSTAACSSPSVLSLPLTGGGSSSCPTPLYLPYVDWRCILSFYRLDEKELLPSVTSLLLNSEEMPPPPQQQSPLPVGRDSSQEEEEEEEGKGEREKGGGVAVGGIRSPAPPLVSSSSPSLDMVWWLALSRIVVTKLSTYDL